MISPSDLIRLPYTPDLTEAGIQSTLRAMPYLQGANLSFDSLRRSVAEVAVELALRRSLAARETPFEIDGVAPFTSPGRYAIRLGGHRVFLNTGLLRRREVISAARANPARLLGWDALTPLDDFQSGERSEQDLFLFAFLLGLTAASRADLERVRAAGQPAALVHPLMPAWSRPPVWVPLGRLTLKSEGPAPLTVELYGQDGQRTFTRLPVDLPPGTRVTIENDFHSLAALRVATLPEGRIGLRCERLPQPYLVPARTWGNLWVYGMELLLAGWLTREEFRRRARLAPADTFVHPYGRLLARQLSVPLMDLRPIEPLLEKVKSWEKDMQQAQ